MTKQLEEGRLGNCTLVSGSSTARTKDLNKLNNLELVDEARWFFDRFEYGHHVTLTSDGKVDYEPDNTKGYLMLDILLMLDDIRLAYDHDQVALYLATKEDGRMGLAVAESIDADVPSNWVPFVLTDRLLSMAINNHYIQPTYQKEEYIDEPVA